MTEPTIAHLLLELRSIEDQYRGIQSGVHYYQIDAWEQQFEGYADRVSERILKTILQILFGKYLYPMKRIYAALQSIGH